MDQNNQDSLVENDDKVDSSDEDMDDEKNFAKLAGLDEKIKSSPYNYQAHVERITLLRNMGELEKLRESRKEMSSLFPLTPELWLQWLEDEQKFLRNSEDHEKLLDLFNLAVEDYISPEIWLEYAQYAICLLTDQNGITKVRNQMEKALSAVGLHVLCGKSVWGAYRDIEKTILMMMQGQQGTTTAGQSDRVSEQVARIGSLYTRQLAVPLLEMESTMEEYLEWRKSHEDGEVPASTRRNYEEAKLQLQPLVELETELQNADPPKLDVFRRYIEFETKGDDVARVQCIYERSIADNCLDSELWLQYLKYLFDKLKSGPVVVSVAHRSVRNCPWTCHLWQRYLEGLERNGEDQEKIDKVEEEAFAVGFASAGDYARLWQTCCDQRRRKVADSQGDERAKALESLRNVFQKATTYLLNNVLAGFNETGDPDFTLWTYWARCEARFANDVTAARRIIDDVMQDAEARRNWKIWREYYLLEMQFGDVAHARSVLRLAVQHSAADDGSAELACATYQQFEREFGSWSDIDEATRRTDARLAKVAKRKEKTAAWQQQQQNSHAGKPRKWNQEKGAKNWKKQQQKKSPGKRALPQENDSVPQKRRKGDQTASQDDNEGFKAPAGLPVRLAKPKGKTPKAEKPKNSVPAPPGFVPEQNREANSEDMETATINSEPTAGQNKPKAKNERPEANEENDKRTVFVSNIGYQVEDIEEKLEKVFACCGEISSVRVVLNNKDKPRGFAYVQFAQQSSVDKALELDRQDLEGRPLYVSPNVDKSKNPDFKIFKYNTAMERHKLFVSGLWQGTNEGRLREVFGQHGEIKTVRVVTARDGRSKGRAYVEYKSAAEASLAVMKTDETLLDGHTIKVAISNPPARNVRSQQDTRDAFRGGRRGRGRTQLSFVPRSLPAKSAESSSTSKGSDDSAVCVDDNQNLVKKGMSNNDFARLFQMRP